ncbi:50S ribosome-binding GTPase [Photobacterium sp. SDRW27]|uniref:YcjF family protein n=1 Tax=Photobacterium obscurum TaxID=2829490 RepID=UPI002243765B|nr:GTPase [Photobacterium obscurum]MCW8327830.1 50S ribosome-binding GTPase [Photobacterium obscurum]
MNHFFKQLYDYINPTVNTDLKPAASQWQSQLPTIWLLGKTGAGKSSLVQAVTGNSAIEVGNGFQPCTQTSVTYRYPEINPLFCFLDTRGLSEADYDPEDDIEACQHQSHALLVVMKAEEPEQSSVLNALKKIRKSGAIKQLLVVHTGICALPGQEERQRAIGYNQDQVQQIWGGEVKSVCLDFGSERELAAGMTELNAALAEMLPILYLLGDEKEHQSREEANFSRLKREVMWYAGTAGASDAIPAVGLVSVPAIQGKMLHSLANQYGVEWDKQRFGEFAGLLGTSFVVQYLSKLGLRQLVKLIPVYGQTVGSATAAAVSFGSTYAIGRAVCKYLYHISKGEPVSEREIKRAFEQAFNHGKDVAAREANKKQH